MVGEFIHLGLGSAIEWQAEDLQKRSAIECEVELVPADITVYEKYSTTLFRIFQESLTIVHRHAKATNVTATLSDKGDSIILDIADNGVRITTENLSKATSFGLLGMRERVQICNGEVWIPGIQNAGTTITVVIPKDKDKH